MGNFHQHPALVGALPLWDGVHPLRSGSAVLPAPCRASYTDIRCDRRSGASLGGDVQGDADADDCGGNSPHHHGGGADLGEPSVDLAARSRQLDRWCKSADFMGLELKN